MAGEELLSSQQGHQQPEVLQPPKGGLRIVGEISSRASIL